MKICVNKFDVYPKVAFAGTRGSYGRDATMELDFSDDWAEYSNAVSFYPSDGGEAVTVVIGRETSLNIPAEIMRVAGQSRYVIWGGDGINSILSVTGYLQIADTLDPAFNMAEDVTPSVEAQLIEKVSSAESAATAAAESAANCERLISECDVDVELVKKCAEESKFFCDSAEASAKEAAEASEEASLQKEAAEAARDRAEKAAEGANKVLVAVDRKLFSNALVGKKIGEAVTLRDISPIEHMLDVKITGADDANGVIVKKIGKNLFDYRAWVQFMNDANAAGIPDGAAREDDVSNGEDCFSYVSWMDAGKTPFEKIRFKANTQYTFSFDAAFYDPNTESYSYPTMFYIYYTDGTFDNVTIPYANVPVNTFKHVKFTSKANMSISFLTVSRFGNTRMLYVKHDMQIEEGTAETEHEAYIEPTEIFATQNGSVEGIISLYPTTTLYTETEGVTIEATYNKDVNKVIEDLTEAIISLGGNV